MTTHDLETYVQLRQSIMQGNFNPENLNKFVEIAARLARLDPKLIQSILESHLKRRCNEVASSAPPT